MEFYVDLIPVFLAVYCLLVQTANYSNKRRRLDKVITLVASVSSILLIFAQTSWWTNAMTGSLQGTVFANSIWAIFNSMVMIAFILFGKSRS